MMWSYRSLTGQHVDTQMFATLYADSTLRALLVFQLPRGMFKQLYMPLF